MWKILARCASGALPSVGMWIIARASGAALAVALVLSGCMPTNTPTRTSPKPSGTPIFASEAEALAAATTAYAAYVKVSDEVLADGGKNPERIEHFASGDALNSALAGYGDFRKRGLHSVGVSKIDHISLQNFSPDSANGGNIVTIYACLDLTDVNVLNSGGSSAVSPERPSRQPFQVSLGWNESNQQLVVSSRDPWSDGGVCENE